jgi:hypothetical protein
MNMGFTLSSLLKAPAEEVWAQLRSPRLMQHVAAPVLEFRPTAGEQLPILWEEGDFEVSLHLFSMVPLGPQTVGIRLLDEQAWPRRVLDDGHSPLIRSWKHWIELEPAGQGTTLYTDRLAICAGVLTPFVWLFARLLFAHRQRRLRTLAATSFQALAAR